MSRSDFARARFNYNTRVRGSVRLAMAEIHQSQDSAENDAPACDLSRKRKFDQLDLQTNVQSPKGNAPEELCSKCQQIDFEAAFQIPDITWKTHGVVIAELGRKGIEWGKTTCPMCRLFAAVCAPSDEPSVADTPHYHLGAFSFLTATRSIYLNNELPEPLRKADSPCLLVLGGKRRSRRRSRGQPPLKFLIDRTQTSGVICPVVSSATEASSRIGTRRLLPDCIDYHMLRSWYGFCAQHHRKSCATTSEEYPKRLSLIDCRTKRIIGAPPKCSYVALSYVWGQQQSTKASSSRVSSENIKPRTLTSDTIPSVITDAMIVTLELGWQYLWVDRYCIDQNDDEEKHVQINQMDKVYSCAVITIIAAAGDSANYGLPGVSNTLRRAQPYAVVRGQLLASTMRSSEVAIGSSRWATRGWTYQEAALSKRRLVFTDDQVFFECKSTSFSESHSVPPALCSEHLLNSCTPIRPRGFFEKHVFTTYWDPRDRFWDDVERFTARELSYETDSLNAFMGMVNYYKDGQGSQSSPVYTHIGLPLDDSEQSSSYGPQFVMSLLWEHSGMQVLPKRRRGFPSFSWVGWKGIADLPLGARALRRAEAMARIVRDPGTDPELSTPLGATLDLEADIVQGQIEVSEKPNFRGLHTSFRLTKWGESGEKDLRRRPIMLPRDFLSRHGLSGGQTFFIDCVLIGYESHFESKSKTIYLLLIEFHGSIAERVGVTRIFMSDEQFRTLPKTRRKIRLG